MNRPVRTRTRGGVGRAGEIPALTRLGSVFLSPRRLRGQLGPPSVHLRLGQWSARVRIQYPLVVVAPLEQIGEHGWFPSNLLSSTESSS